MERRFNAGQAHSSTAYPSIFNRLRATELAIEILIANCNFSLLLAFNAPIRGDRDPLGGLDDLRDFWLVSCRMARLVQWCKNIPEKLTPPE